MSIYHIYGRPFAGSLIAEFLLREAGQNYTLSFPEKEECLAADFLRDNPLGRIPVMVCPDGAVMFESLAIVQYLTGLYPGLAPEINTVMGRHYLCVITMLATNMYPAMHRQHHTYQYAKKPAFEDVKALARGVNDRLYDYLETVLNPYICQNMLTAADFYLYMLCRWEPDKTAMRANRPKLAALFDELRMRPSVVDSIENQTKSA